MGEFARKADGRRIFTPEFKREVMQQILSWREDAGGAESRARHQPLGDPHLETALRVPRGHGGEGKRRCWGGTRTSSLFPRKSRIGPVPTQRQRQLLEAQPLSVTVSMEVRRQQVGRHI